MYYTDRWPAFEGKIFVVSGQQGLQGETVKNVGIKQKLFYYTAFLLGAPLQPPRTVLAASYVHIPPWTVDPTNSGVGAEGVDIDLWGIVAEKMGAELRLINQKSFNGAIGLVPPFSTAMKLFYFLKK